MQNTKYKIQDTKYVDLNNARLDEQKKVMKDIINADECPFCMENIRKYHKQEILKDGKYWILTYNQWPYDHTRIHLLLITKEHATTLAELDPQAGVEMIEMLTWAEKEFKALGGAIGFRFGDTDYSAGTVNHLHAQFIVPDIDEEGFEPVRLKIGTKKK